MERLSNGSCSRTESGPIALSDEIVTVAARSSALPAEPAPRTGADEPESGDMSYLRATIGL